MDATRERLQSFLLGEAHPPDPETLRRQGLGGWAFASVTPDHPYRATLRNDFIQSLQRHHQIKQELLPLLAAWRRAGVEFLLFKGFWLAETVYPAPGLRFYGDVDVLVPEAHIDVAKAAAVHLHWAELTGLLRHKSYSHAAVNLKGPRGHTCLDVHRFLLHSRLPCPAAQRRITRALWARSGLRSWNGLDVRELDPVDAALVLILQRGWGEGWQLKPADILDLRCLVDHAGVRYEQLAARANELNCWHSVRIFLERCDPWRRRLELRAPTAQQLRRYQLAVLPERPLLLFQNALKIWLAILRRGPRLCADIIRALPAVWRARRALRGGGTIGQILDDLTPTLRSGDRGTASQRMRTIAGVRWAVRLVTFERGTCLLRSLAIYHALRRSGCPVSFVSGVRRVGGQVNGHAWVELNGEILPELRESIYRDFVISFRHPP